MEYLIKKEIKQLLQKLQEKCIEKNKKQGSNLNIEDYLFDMLVKVDNPEFRSDEDNEGLHLVEDILDNLILEVKSGIEIKSITETLFNDSELVEKLNNFLAENTEDYINCNLVRELYKKEPILTKDLLSDIFKLINVVVLFLLVKYSVNVFILSMFVIPVFDKSNVPNTVIFSIALLLLPKLELLDKYKEFNLTHVVNGSIVFISLFCKYNVVKL